MLMSTLGVDSGSEGNEDVEGNGDDVESDDSPEDIETLSRGLADGTLTGVASSIGAEVEFEVVEGESTRQASRGRCYGCDSSRLCARRPQRRQNYRQHRCTRRQIHG